MRNATRMIGRAGVECADGGAIGMVSGEGLAESVRSADAKRPESVLILICTEGGEVLMLERTRPHGFWQSVTGSLHWAESPGAAAARELLEETGLHAGAALRDLRRGERFPIVPPWRARYASGVRLNREHWFLLELPGRRTIQLDPGEHRQFRWLDAQQALRRASSWTNRKLIGIWLSARWRGQALR